MTEPKPLQDCEWKAEIQSFVHQYRFAVSTNDGEHTYFMEGKIFENKKVCDCSDAIADCEAFMARNGFKKWKWVE